MMKKKKIFSIFLMCIFILFSQLTLAKVLLVYRKDIKFYEKIAHNLEKSLKEETLKCILDDQCKIQCKIITKDFKVVIALGDKATNYAYNFKKPLLSFFITDYSLKNKCPHKRCIFFPLFPKLPEILKEIDEIFPQKPKKILILYSENTNAWIEDILPAKKNSKIITKKMSLEIFDEIRDIFQEDYDLYILAPDYIFLQEKVLKEIVKISYITKKPVIGFSTQMLNYGIPIVISYNLSEMAKIVPQIVNDYLTNKLIPQNLAILNVSINKKAFNFFSKPRKNNF
jgi:hypothetical protein